MKRHFERVEYNNNNWEKIYLKKNRLKYSNNKDLRKYVIIFDGMGKLVLI